MTQDYFFIKTGSIYKRIAHPDILYIEAAANYTKLFTVRGMYLTYVSMKQWQVELPGSLFCKVHRTYIVSLSMINQIDKTGIQIGETVIPIGSQYKKNLLERIRIIQRSFQLEDDTK